MQDTASPPTRPILVLILAILTIVGSILGLGYAAMKEAIPDLGANDVPMPVWVNAITYAMLVGKLVAAIFLIMMRRLGFYLYCVFEGISAMMSIVGGKIGMDYMDTSYVNPGIPFDPRVLMMVIVGIGIGLSIAFIGGYAAHLSKMK